MTEQRHKSSAVQKVQNRTTEQILQDRIRVAEIAAISDLTHREIAEIMTDETGRHITERQVKYDLENLRRSWIQENKAQFETVMRKEEVRLDRLEAEAWDAWQRSQDNEETETLYFPNGEETRDEQSGEVKPPKFSRTLARKKQAGNTKVLDTILKIQQERRKMMGLYPTKESEAAKVETSNQLNVTKIYYGVSPLAWPGTNKEIGMIIDGEVTTKDDEEN